MQVGFTGTRKGMTEAQYSQVMILLSDYKSPPMYLNYAIHGKCIGADEQFNAIAHDLHYWTIAYPANDVSPRNVSKCFCNEVRTAQPALVRNRTIIDESKVMLATPKGFEEEWRGSGTWAAIRYAKQVKKPLYLIFPDGTVDKLNGAK